MTNEEMVYYLEHADITVGQKCKTKTAEAIDEVLKMIKSQPCADCINREETLNRINALIAEYIPLMPTGWTLPLNIAKTINELPSVTPSRPKGKWIREESLDGSIRYMCDNCKEFEYVDYYNFCPNCGADMREEQDEARKNIQSPSDDK